MGQMPKYMYDVALSFAEEDLAVAKQIADSLKANGISYYLYTEHNAEYLGKTLLKITQQVYGKDTRHVLMLTSKVFVTKYWTAIESQIVQIAAFERPDFIFRVRLDETPVDGISKHLFSLKWDNNPEEIAEIVKKKIELEKNATISSNTKKDNNLIKVASPPTVSKKMMSPKNKLIMLFVVILLGAVLIMSRFIFAVSKKNSQLEKVYIPAGSFMMGVDNSWNIWKPSHKVSLPAFYMSKTEVTVAQYREFCNQTDNEMPPAPPYSTGDNFPVVNITWAEADAYCRWIGGRLPTEAEWEYAAGKNGRPSDKYSGGNAIDKVGYYAGNAKKAHEVGQKKGNAIGLFDMSGNVAEWCNDWFGLYQSGEQYKPQGAVGDSKWKVVRGGHYESRIASDTSANELRIS